MYIGERASGLDVNRGKRFSKAASAGYAGYVTTAARRRVYWALFVAACLCLAAAVLLAVPLFIGAVNVGVLERAGALRESRLFGLGISSLGSSAASTVLASLYATLCLGFVLYSFRKTVSPEIFFFSFWVLSLGLECSRLFVFHLAAEGAPTALVHAAARVTLAARTTGLLALFTASLFAAGFRSEKPGSAALLIMLIGAGLARSVPLNSGAYEPTLMLRPGFSALLDLLALASALATAAGFFHAARVSGERSYRAVALGTIALLVGQRLLVTDWRPLSLMLGFGLVLAGSWLFVSRLHAYYLWQ